MDHLCTVSQKLPSTRMAVEIEELDVRSFVGLFEQEGENTHG